MPVEGSVREGSLVFDPSANTSFGVFDASKVRKPEYGRLKAVVIGGGTGAPMSIRAATALGASTSAVVAMADDGGSTGIIRQMTAATPPGDIRKCLAAFARNPDDALVRAFSSRLSFDDNHALGNLMLVALEQTSGGFMEAVGLCERLLDALGHVYPCTLSPVTFHARTTTGRELEGQKASCLSNEPLDSVWLTTPADAIDAYAGACQAIGQADVVILGPGSLFTSVISNLAVPGIRASLRSTDAAIVYVCSVADTQGETRGMGVLDHVRALERHGLEGCVDYVLVNEGELAQPMSAHIEAVRVREGEREALASRGTCVLESSLADRSRPTWHNPTALCAAFAEVFDLCLSRKR